MIRKSTAAASACLVMIGLMGCSTASHTNRNIASADGPTVISIGNPGSWTPKVGDDAIYDVSEEEPSGDVVATGSLEKKVTAIGSIVSIQVTYNRRDYNGTSNTSTKTMNELSLNIQNTASEARDCSLDALTPVTIKTGSGNYSACLSPQMIGTDLNSNSASINNYTADIPFGVVRTDTLNLTNKNHIRTTFKKFTPGS